MQSHGNELSIYRGETFTIAKNIQNKDGSPYIVSNKLKNPYWLITVASSLYDERDRYVLNKWLSLKTLPRFELTTPVRLKSIDPSYSFDKDNIPAGYEGNKALGYADIAVFYDEGDNGVISYKYWEYINNEDKDYRGKWVDYHCGFLTSFLSNMTSKWVSQNYYYQITLVDGESTEDYLKNTAERLGISTDSLKPEELVEAIKSVDETLISEINLSRPIVSFDTEYPILSPTKISVRINLKEV